MLRICMIVVCMGLFITPAWAQSLSGEIKKNYEHMKTFKATFVQKLSHKESGTVEERKGTLLFQKPLMVRWETAKPHAELLIITDKEIWDYLPDEAVVYRYSPELVKDSRSLIQVITGQARLDQDFSVKDEGQENGLYTLRLYPKEPSPQMVEAVIWVDAGKKIIQKASIIDFYGNTNEVTFTEIHPDVSLGAKTFQFTPPKGVEVEDHMDKVIQERELFK